MGLFDDLPSAKRDAPASARDDSPAAKRAAAAETDADRTRARSSDPVKSRAEPALRDGGARDPERRAASHAEALERLSAHIANPAKFKRASALAAELMRSGELERRHGKSVFALLAAAMTPPSRAVDPRTRFEYRDLFAAAERCADEGVLNAKHAKRLRGVFLVYVNLVNRAFTDDAFEFARFAKDVADRVDALPPYEPEPVAPEEPDHAHGNDAHGNDAHGNAPSSGASEARATALRMRRAEFDAAREDWRVVDETRDALLFAVESARSRYRLAWAQSTVDVLIGKVDALERACARFGPDQRDRFRKARDAARAERDARRAGAGAGEKSERATAFDRDAAAYRNASVSARGGVGGEGTRDGRGESAIR